MLILFTVENFLSFKDEVEFSMVAAGRLRKHKDHVITNGKRGDIRLLKTAVIYGANASGKSNLIKAMAFARELIVSGTQGTQNIATVAFRFDSETKNRPSKFQFEIKCAQRVYIYGFEVDKQRVHSEWLYEMVSSREKMLFERETDRQGKTVIAFGKLAYTTEQNEQFFRFVATGTRQNQLFLKECFERNVLLFAEINKWFTEKLVLIFPDDKPAGIELAFLSDEAFQNNFVDLIKLFDLGIDSIGLEDFDLDKETRISDEVKDRIKQEILQAGFDPASRIVIQIPQLNILVFVDENQEVISKKIMTLHKVAGEEKSAQLELTEESDGTQRVFEIVPALFELINKNSERVFIIDELDRRLHRLLSYKILEIFLAKSQYQNSQLIVTTHEVGILDLELLRRDEIWFIEKNAKGASSVFSLEEYHPRYDKDIRKSYLQGRFGAIPLLPSRHLIETQ